MQITALQEMIHIFHVFMNKWSMIESWRELEVLWEHEPWASVSITFSNTPKC